MTEQDSSAYSLQTTLEGISPAQLTGFFVGWPNPPSPETFYRLLAGSYRFVLAVQGGQVIGFVQAVSDGVLTAFVPLLEVRPEHQGQGIGRALMERLLAELADFYAVDLACDDDLVPFYEGLGLRWANLMFRRNYARQQGRPATP
ncbi:GNAT family N-acetyltransferase [Deinococcus multiflagellatus]|uniref:GNAT family N-acetyltransferase n=1 Tax=Deinococcus multiflagellatus TaxID=1656887 RepID=A0ABW1ZE98_9DEIO|nr:GNAT family N-acetyltransferase [Deinococcus multiflagellatus]MBZ9712927.1 GNAT family N-acetyltransferase [Deinococcus multiflagellatus]